MIRSVNGINIQKCMLIFRTTIRIVVQVQILIVYIVYIYIRIQTDQEKRTWLHKNHIITYIRYTLNRKMYHGEKLSLVPRLTYPLWQPGKEGGTALS